MSKRITAEIVCTDIEEALDWETWQPPDPDDVHVVLLIIVERPGARGTSNFQLVVATTAGLQRKLEGDTLVEGRHTVFLREWDGRLVRQYIDRVLDRASQRPDDEQIAYLSRYFFWEYEDETLIRP